MDINKVYDKCVEFHGHACPGLAIGVRAAVEFQRILGIDFSQNEEVVCVTENDACGVDGIQVVLGCSVGKGNLIFRMRGKQAFSVFNRKNGQAVRLVLKNLPKMASRAEKQQYLLEAPFDDIFIQTVPAYALPEEARLFGSIDCEACGESTAELYVRIEDGKKVCLDCFREYHRV